MATSIYTNPHGWHEGESQMHRLLHVPEYDNPSSFGLSFHATRLLQSSSMLAVGTLDDEGRPWTTLIGGEPGFARSLGSSVVGARTVVGPKYDPVIKALVSKDGKGKVLSALGIHLDTRDRVKLSGRLLGSGLVDISNPDDESPDLQTASAAEFQMAFVVDHSLGNCPKYLNRKSLLPVVPQPVLKSDSLPLSTAAISLLSKTDMFFISTSNHLSSMGTNHRGGAPGFVRVASNTAQRTTLIYPEYSGNRLYQTLGNLYTTPSAGLVFPDFSTGDVLYVTGTTEITYGKEAAELLPRSNLLVKIHLTTARYVQHGLAFHAADDSDTSADAPSPYNPPVRYLPSERAITQTTEQTSNTLTATLIAKTILTPTIARFRFRISGSNPGPKPPTWKAGQYVALAFGDELDAGYSHMRDDDPRSLNDDFVRTFTVSSAPPPPLPSSAPSSSGRASAPTPAIAGTDQRIEKSTTKTATTTTTTNRGIASAVPSNNNEFELTIRNVGSVTGFLFRQNVRAGLDLPLRGFGGSFVVERGDVGNRAESGSEIGTGTGDGGVVPFIAGGIGITPLLSQLSADESRGGWLRLYWTVNIRDMGLVIDTLERFPGLARSTEVFVSGGLAPTLTAHPNQNQNQNQNQQEAEEEKQVKRVQSMGAKVVRRRITASDLDLRLAGRWYLCAGTVLRKELLRWLDGKTCVFEDFDY